MPGGLAGAIHRSGRRSNLWCNRAGTAPGFKPTMESLELPTLRLTGCQIVTVPATAAQCVSERP